jgi:hypothetical protein
MCPDSSFFSCLSLGLTFEYFKELEVHQKVTSSKKVTKNEKGQQKQPRIMLKQPPAHELTSVMLR